jgi:hypothetical protein
MSQQSSQATDSPKRTVPVAALLLIGVLTVGIVIWKKRH